MKMLRINQLCERLCVSKATICRILKNDKTFPKPHNISQNIRAFSESETHQWIESKK
jgi:predicted DNA-binding transcriptional regulator AlpA